MYRLTLRDEQIIRYLLSTTMCAIDTCVTVSLQGGFQGTSLFCLLP